jgi:hypothetical protein
MAQILRHECCIPGQEQVKEGTMTVVDKLYADKAALRKVLEAFASSDMEARWLSRGLTPESCPYCYGQKNGDNSCKQKRNCPFTEARDLLKVV